MSVASRARERAAVVGAVQEHAANTRAGLLSVRDVVERVEFAGVTRPVVLAVLADLRAEGLLDATRYPSGVLREVRWIGDSL